MGLSKSRLAVGLAVVPGTPDSAVSEGGGTDEEANMPRTEVEQRYAKVKLRRSHPLLRDVFMVQRIENGRPMGK